MNLRDRSTVHLLDRLIAISKVPLPPVAAPQRVFGVYHHVAKCPMNTFGTYLTVISDCDAAVPARLSTSTTEVFAAIGTITLTLVGAVFTTRADKLPISTFVTSERFDPVIVSFFPGVAEAGL